MKGDPPDDLDFSNTEAFRRVVFPEFKSTIIGVLETGHTKQRDEELGQKRTCRGVCCKNILIVLVLLITSHNISDLSAADARIRLPLLDQQILVMGEEHSSSLSSLAMPLVSKSQITQLPSLHPADSIDQISKSSTL